MKKRFFLVILLLAALLCSTALAMTTEEFNKQARWKTSRSTPVYRVISCTPLGPDDDPGSAYTFEEAGTIPAGTYLGSRLHGVDGKSEMCMMIGGQMVDYYVPSNAICEATRTVTIADGRRISVPELAYGDEAAVRTYLTSVSQEDIIEDFLRVMKAKPAKQSSSAGKHSAPAPAEWNVKWTPDNDSTVTAQLLQLGIYSSRIQVDGEEHTVPTLSLRFGSGQVDPERYVASVCTKTTGYVTLRREPDQKAAALGKIPDGRLVGVIEPGDSFTLVSYNGLSGYVVTRGLTFHAADQEPVGEGVFFQRGKEYTSIFLTPTVDARWLAKWKQGESVTVIAELDNYYEVEKDGLCGWLRKAYVTFN